MAPLYTLITFALPLLSLAALAPIEAQSKLQSIINSQSKASIAELEPLWSALPPITVAKALGIYKGGLFNGPPPLVNGSVPKAARDPINWWGKQIISDFSVNPLLANAPSDSSPDGRDVSIIFPYPRKDIAQARDVVHQGVASATIIYAKFVSPFYMS
ncbi:DUF4334 domain-containing protein [Venturia nashicola]|nr:DUF4334 domain-containing protein [Venturia nashicola]